MKWSHTDYLDASLNYLKNNATRIVLCSAQPATYAEATTIYDGGAGKYRLAMKTISASDFTGPSTGDVSGRKVQSNAHTGLTADATANATHIAWCDAANTKLLYVTTCTQQAVTAGNLVNLPALKIEHKDPE